MIIKNGLLDYLMVLAFQIVMSLLLFDGITEFLAMIVFSVTLVVFFLRARHVEKKAELLRTQIYNSRKVICEGPVTHNEGHGDYGWMFLSEDAIEFYSCKGGEENIPILLDDIERVEKKFKKLKIYTKYGEVFSFAVPNSNRWRECITRTI